MQKFISLKLKRVHLILMLLMLTCAAVNAQIPYARNTAGFNYVIPKTLSSGYSSEPLRGINIRTKVVEMGYYAGKFTTPLDSQKLFYNVYLGVNFPIRALGFGRRQYGIKGASVVPFLAGGFGIMGSDGQKSAQGTFSPGISLQLPYVVIDFKVNAVVGFDNVPGLKRSKFMIAPAIVLQFDGLMEVMDPELSFDHTNSGYYVWSEGREIDYNTTEWTTYYVPFTEDVYRRNIGAHISLGPRVCSWNLKNGNNKTLMYGLTQSGRAGNFGYDLIAETGKITTPDGDDLSATRAMGRLSINLNVSKGSNTFFTRFMIGGGIGYNWFTKDSPYVHSENGEFMNLFCSLEFGACAFSYEVNKAFNEKFDDQKYFAFQYRIPIERVAYRYRQLRNSK